MPVSVAEVSPPEQTIAPPTQTPEPPSRSRRVLVVAAVAAAVLTVILILAVHRGTSFRAGSAPKSNVVTGAAPLLRLNGTTEAVHLRSIIVPMLSGERFGLLTVTRLLPTGTRVHRDDVLAEFDRQAQMREFIDKQAAYVDLVTKTSEAQAKEDADRAKDETEMRQAESALSKAQLEMQKVELLSKIDAEKTEESLEEAKATLDQLRTTFDLKRQAAQAGIRLLEIQRDRSKQVMEHAQANAAVMQMRSPIDGVVVLKTIWKEGRMAEAQEGDQIRSGMAFMEVVDPSQMQVRAQVNQEDLLVLRQGVPARIRLDAYPELVFRGKLEEMAPIGRNGDFSSKLRTFAVVFSIDGNDSRLMPDLSAAVDVVQDTQNSSPGS